MNCEIYLLVFAVRLFNLMPRTLTVAFPPLDFLILLPPAAAQQYDAVHAPHWETREKWHFSHNTAAVVAVG